MIKGLTDRDSIKPRFPRIGKLRKGGEKTGNKPGMELSYWRFTSERDDVTAAFEAAYGSEPQQINVYLPHTSVDDNFPTWKEEWKSGGLAHRCDGETCTIWLGDDGKYHRDPKPCPGGCTEVGRLEVVIPELMTSGHVGTVTMETHSLNDLISITETLRKTEELRGDNPDGLRGILFALRRVPEKISVPGFGQNAGKRQRVEKWLVKIEPAVDWVQAQMALSRTDTPQLDDYDVDGLPALEAGTITEIKQEEANIRYLPDQLKALIQESITRRRDASFSFHDKRNNYLTAMVGNLESCFHGDRDASAKRHAVAWYLTGKESSKDMDDAEIKALHGWLGTTKGEDGEWSVNPESAKEAHAVYAEAMRVMGQQPLFAADDRERPFTE